MVGAGPLSRVSAKAAQGVTSWLDNVVASAQVALAVSVPSARRQEEQCHAVAEEREPDENPVR